MSTELSLVPSSPLSNRAEEVLEQILSIKTTLMQRYLELGRLLKEARDNDYAMQWGFPRFGDWVEQASGLDMSARSAYYAISVIELGDQLALPDSELAKVKRSKLESIAALKPGEMTDDQKRELILNAQTMTLTDVNEVIGIAKQQEWVNRNYKFDKTGYENTIKPALERVKREHGDTLSETGEVSEISDSKAIEIVCADYAAGPENEAEYGLDAEYEDVLEAPTPYLPIEA